MEEIKDCEYKDDQTALVDLTINADLIDTRDRDDEPVKPDEVQH